MAVIKPQTKYSQLEAQNMSAIILGSLVMISFTILL